MKNIPSKKRSNCDATSNKKQNLEDHVVLVHDWKNSFKCDICDTKFTRKR